MEMIPVVAAMTKQATSSSEFQPLYKQLPMNSKSSTIREMLLRSEEFREYVVSNAGDGRSEH